MAKFSFTQETNCMQQNYTYFLSALSDAALKLNLKY